LLAAALAARLLWVWLHPVNPQSDFREYHTIATYVVERGGYYGTAVPSAPDAFWPPAWPTFLAGLYSVFGVDARLAAYVTAFLSWGTVVAGALVAVRLLRPAFAAVAVAAMAFYPAGLFFTGVLGTEHLAGLLIMIIVLLLLRGRLTALTALVAGVLDGVLLLLHSDFGLVMSGVIVLTYLVREREAPPMLRLAATSAIVAALVVAPWTIRNERVFGDFIPFSTNGGITFWLGTLRADYEPPERPADQPRVTDPKAFDSFYWERGLDNVKSEPLTYAKYVLLRVGILYCCENALMHWSHVGWDGGADSKVLAALEAAWVPLLVLAIAGLLFLALDWRRGGPPWARGPGVLWFPVVTALVLATLLKIFFIVDARQRLPLVPLVLLLTGYGVQRLFEWRAGEGDGPGGGSAARAV
jgi:hypothetical protein